MLWLLWEGTPQASGGGDPPPPPDPAVTSGTSDMNWVPWNRLVEGPEWHCVTRSYTDFTAEDTSDTDTIFTLPPGGVIHAVKIRHKEAFSGASISAAVVDVGVSGTANKYGTQLDVFQGVSATAMSIKSTIGTQNNNLNTAIIATLTLTDGNCSELESGIVQFWILWSQPR